MRKRQISLTFETGLLATIAIALSLWTLLRLIGVATFAGAGCQQHGMHIDLAHIKEYCKIIKTTGYSGFANLLALATAACNGWRLAGWYTRGIWHRPLLWSMHLSLAGMVFGFLLYGSQLFWSQVSDSLAMHTLALSGIGLLTLSMMARVSLGHSGRNIHEPPRLLIFALYLLCLGFICRILLPLAAPAQQSHAHYGDSLGTLSIRRRER